MKNIHTRIAFIAKNENLSIAQFERKLGVGRNMIAESIRKKSAINHLFLQKIADNFPNYSLHWIITGKKEESKKELLRKILQLLKNI